MPMFSTFYSFKGGVGRSLALANVAGLLSRDRDEPCRVLAWDFDLAAPGLHKVLKCDLKGHKRGFIDYVHHYLANAALDDISSYIYPTAIPGVDLLPAGELNRNYGRKLEGINWKEIYRFARGFQFIQHVRDQISRLVPGYDYVLVDSLTGYSDVGGICVNQLPDVAVFLFRLNEQNLNGIATVHKALQKFNEQRRNPVAVIPVVSQAWPFAAPDAAGWFDKAHKLFPEKRLLEISFEASLTYGEKLITGNAKQYGRSKIFQDYRRLAEALRELNPSDLKTIYSQVRHRIENREEMLEACVKLVTNRPHVQRYWDVFVDIAGHVRPGIKEHALRERAFNTVNEACERAIPQAFLARGQLRDLWNESWDSVFSDLSRAVELDPSLDQAYYIRATRSLEHGDYTQAIDDLTVFLSRAGTGRSAAMALAERARAYLKLRRPTDAVSDLDNALKLQPKQSSWTLRRAKALYLAGRYEEALADIDDILHASYDYHATLLQAHLLAASGRAEVATEKLQQILENASRQSGNELNVAEVYLLVNPLKTLELAGRFRRRAHADESLEVIRNVLKAVAATLLSNDQLEEEARDELRKLAQLKKNEKRGFVSWDFLELHSLLAWAEKNNRLRQDKITALRQLIANLEASDISHVPG